MKFKKAFATRLRRLREYAELTQVELAEKLGVSRGTISYYENEERVADIEFLEDASAYFGIDPEYLLGWSDNAFTSNKQAGLALGLSDTSLDKLDALMDVHSQYPDDVGLGYQIEFLNYFIENKYFYSFLNMLEKYCEKDFEKHSLTRKELFARSFSGDLKNDTFIDTGYLEYVLSRIIIKMFDDIKNEYRLNNSERIKAINEHIKEQEKLGRSADDVLEDVLKEANEEVQKVLDEMEKMRIEDEEEDKKLGERLEQDEDYQIRRKVHDKLRGKTNGKRNKT